MFLGVLVHASHADFDLGEYELIRFLSGSFRMPCFFIIAGFFSVMVMEKMPLGSFLRKRSLMLGVPALTCVIVLVPITVALMKTYFLEGGAESEPHSGWMGHAWFLFVLLVYTLFLHPLNFFVDRAVRALSRVLGEIAAFAVFFILLLLGAMFVSKVIQKFGPLLPYYAEWKFLVSSIVGNLPHFVLGIMMYRWAIIYRFLHQHIWFWTFAVILMLPIKYALSGNEITSTGQHLVYMVISYLTAYAVSAWLFALSSRVVNKHSNFVRIFSESAYTVYVVHYIVIAAVLLELQRIGFAMLPRMLLAFLAASVVGIIIHLFLVKKFSLASFALNGKFAASQG